jgi:uncharacterized protein with von Willebrand factor type A (vWA) domain
MTDAMEKTVAGLRGAILWLSPLAGDAVLRAETAALRSVLPYMSTGSATARHGAAALREVLGFEREMAA